MSGLPCCSGQGQASFVAGRPSPRLAPATSALAGRQQTRRGRAQHQPCTAGMGIGFTEEYPAAGPASGLVVPSPEYGLTVKQMQVLGLTNDGMTKLPAVSAVRGGRGRWRLEGGRWAPASLPEHQQGGSWCGAGARQLLQPGRRRPSHPRQGVAPPPPSPLLLTPSPPPPRRPRRTRSGQRRFTSATPSRTPRPGGPRAWPSTPRPPGSRPLTSPPSSSTAASATSACRCAAAGSGQDGCRAAAGGCWGHLGRLPGAGAGPVCQAVGEAGWAPPERPCGPALTRPPSLSRPRPRPLALPCPRPAPAHPPPRSWSPR